MGTPSTSLEMLRVNWAATDTAWSAGSDAVRACAADGDWTQSASPATVVAVAAYFRKRRPVLSAVPFHREIIYIPSYIDCLSASQGDARRRYPRGRRRIFKIDTGRAKQMPVTK